MSMAKIELLSSDDKLIVVEREVIEKSQTLNDMLEDLESNEDGPISIFLPNVKGIVLDKVLDFLRHEPVKQDNVKKSSDPRFGTPDWEWQYLDVDNATLFEVILAANYLDIKPLLDLSCRRMAIMVKNKSEEELLKDFGVKEPFTKEHYNELYKEYPWLDDREK